MREHSAKEGFETAPPNHLERHAHAGHPGPRIQRSETVVALVGNPNVGKSLVFSYLSGMYVEVSNYPGTTIEYTRGSYHTYDLFDTPGVYGISTFTSEEVVTRDVVLQSDVVLNIVDACHLERDLFLTQQLIDMGKRVAVVLTMMDEARKTGLEIDTKLLSASLGIPIIETIATTHQGFDQIDTALRLARRGRVDEALHHKLHEMLKLTGSEAEALLILEGDETLASKHGVPAGHERESLYIERRNQVNILINAVLSERSVRARFASTLGRLALNPWTGIPLLLVALYLIYLFVGKLIANDLVGFTELTLGHGLWEPWIRGMVARVLPLSSWLSILLVGDFGIISMTITYLLFLLLPLVIAFYLALAIMEDSGYLPRLATLVDRSLSGIGLNGAAVIPLILGFGCVTMATITTRLLGNEREKTIAAAILQFAIPCSAQLAVVAALLAGAGFTSMLIYSVTIFAIFVAVGTVLHRFLPGSTTPLLIDLPPMRLPRIDNVLRKTAYRSYYFMKEATPWFFIGALAVGLMEITGLLALWQDLLAPLTTHWLQLPRDASTAFVMGMVRRDFGAAGLFHLSLSEHQTVVSLVTITLFTPCIASFMIMMKERGIKEALIVWVGTWVVAFLVGGVLSQILL